MPRTRASAKKAACSPVKSASPRASPAKRASPKKRKVSAKRASAKKDSAKRVAVPLSLHECKRHAVLAEWKRLNPTSKRTHLTVKEAEAAGIRRFRGEDKISKTSARSAFFKKHWKKLGKGAHTEKQRQDHFRAEVKRIGALWRESGQCGVKKAKKSSGKRAKKASGKKVCK
jgi:hypothetical protein